MLAVFPRKIQIKVWRRLSIEIDESLKVKIQLYRVNICDFKKIGDYTICATSSSYIEIILFLRIADNVPVDKEIGGECLFLNDVKLLF